MLCIRCSAENPPAAKYCQQCQALLLRGVPQTPQALEISEDQTYVLPEERFLSRHLNELHDLLAELLETGQGEPEARQLLEQLAKAHEDFRERAVPGLMDMLLHEEQLRPGHDFPGQVRYLVHTGVDLFGRGLVELQDLSDPVRVEAAFETLQQGNDNLCLSFVMVEQRKRELESHR